MTSDVNGGSQWERVAAELRACREAQQRAWGDIDNTTLGRYLADEVTAEERQHIEGALDELPELRKLTDLVRDVLCESEAAVAEPVSVPYGPAILPFPQPQARSEATARPTVSCVPSQTATPPRNWNERVRAGRYRQRAGLVAVAALLLALGVALPRSGSLASSQSESDLAVSPFEASRIDLSSLIVRADSEDVASELMRKRLEDNPAEPENQLAGIDAAVQSLKAEGKTAEAESLARNYTNNLTRRGMFYREKGDLARAEPALNQAQALSARTLGFEAPETIRTRNSLANVYEVALNTVPPPDDFRAAPSSDRAVTPANAQPPRSMAKDFPAARVQALSAEKATGYGSAAPAVRVSSSAYGAAQPAPKMQTPSYSLQGVKQSVRSSYGAYSARPSRHAQQTAMIALRERITRPTELKSSVVPVLTQALREATGSAERQRLARALGQLGPAAHKSVPVLLDCYRKATSEPERSAILLTLGQIGPAARQALKDLAQKSADDPLIQEVMRRISGRERSKK